MNDAVFDTLVSGDFLVNSRDQAVRTAQDLLGIEAPKPHWSHGGAGFGYQVTFCRVNRSLIQAPTLLELIEPMSVDLTRPIDEILPNTMGLAHLQGKRPLRTHYTVVASSALDEVIENVHRQGLRHWVHPAGEANPYRRLWMGVTQEEVSGYEPDADGGLMIEVVDTAVVRLPSEAFTAADPAPDSDLGAGGMVRLLSRGFLVDDLSYTLDRLASTFGWEPERGPERAPDGSRRAEFGFRLPRSARIEVLEPSPTREEGEFLRQWGRGVWHVRIGVRDLAAKAEDLTSRGTPFRQLETGFDHPPVVLRVDSASTPDCLFEFAEIQE